MWRRITEDDLVATLSRDELEAFRRDFETDPVPALLDETAAWVRGFIRTNGNVRMDPDEFAIPLSCVSPAMDYAAIKVLKRLAIEPTEIRKQARADAIEFFNSISEGRVNPESCDAASSASTGGPAAQVVTSSRIRTGFIEGF